MNEATLQAIKSKIKEKDKLISKAQSERALLSREFKLIVKRIKREDLREL